MVTVSQRPPFHRALVFDPNTPGHVYFAPANLNAIIYGSRT